ncbi:transporter substrate-binding domain-containing protein [Vallitalea pronyensis]|uniref:Transporter substrate-binding domain-containing protein n=1 Tax=Vallitalea pronyensis TaxID=1348613 RepID=A0A8J8MI60_9FIRM|nr:transporter substrate-binding domain-containing protein [Vallitalea pronyensis]QUI21668.1 transporter substrate-binding domain-containing protein [Vallitalea pronyensis]
MKRIIGLICSLIGLTCMIIFFANKNVDKLGLTDEEKRFISENKDTIFLVGYFPTSAEKKFCEKLCEKIEEDTSLKLRIYENTWNNSLYLLANGKLPIVMNMCKIPKREEYAYFTDTFLPIPCGIYSDQNHIIQSFEDIKNKKIGVEKEVALLDKFVSKFPGFKDSIIVFDTFEETRNAYVHGEIDGFLASKSYDSDMRGLYFFPIESITAGSNHVGVSQSNPLLYSIINKEVTRLKEEKWDVLVLEVITFELEKSFIEFNQVERHYLEEKSSFKVGLPTEYFLYGYGEAHNPQGPLPEILEKIAFICDVDFVYEFDTLDNLRLRKDIDFFVDYDVGDRFTSKTIFEDEIIIVARSYYRYVNEVYDLANYNVGVYGVPNATSYLKENMPHISVMEYKNIDVAVKNMKKKKLDYLIIPRLYYETKKSVNQLSMRGKIETNINNFVSRDPLCVEIIDKCLTIIDTETIVHNRVAKKPKANVSFLILLYIVSTCLFVIVLRMLTRWYRKNYYYDNKFDVYNMRYITKKLKHKDAYLVLIEISDEDQIWFHYGRKVYDKYLKNLIDYMKKEQIAGQYMALINRKQLLIVKESIREVERLQNRLLAIQGLMIDKVMLTYNYHLCYVDYMNKEELSEAMDKLHNGLLLAKKSNQMVYYTKQQHSIYLNNLARNVDLKKKIASKAIQLVYRKIIGKDGQYLGNYVYPKCNGLRRELIYKKVKDLNIETKLDKVFIEEVLKHEQSKPLFLHISERTLISENFYTWLDRMMKEGTVLYFIIDRTVASIHWDSLVRHKQIGYVIDRFGEDMVHDLQVKYYDSQYIIIDRPILEDMEDNAEVLDFIASFAQKNKLKIISSSQYYSEADYYIVEE